LRTALAALLSCALLSCTPGSSTGAQATPGEDAAKDRLVIVATVFAAYDFSRTIAGAVAEVRLLVPPGVESHSFEPSPADMMLLSSADVFLCAGGESDAWLDKVLASLDNPHLVVVKMMDLVEVLAEEDSQGASPGFRSETPHANQAAHEQEQEPEPDEHVWTSLRNAQLIVAYCAGLFSQLNAEHAALYQANAKAYQDELARLDTRITTIVQSAQRTTVVFGDRFPCRYFTEDYGLTCYAAFSGCSTAVDTNPSTLVFLIDTVRAQDLPGVFYLELSSRSIARTIAEETGAEMLLFHSAHTISQADFDAGTTYLDLMRANADNLEVALN